MRSVLLIFLMLALPLAFAARVQKIDWEESWEEEFLKWKKVFVKVYETAEEEILRKGIWKQNLQKILKHNLEHEWGLHSYRLSMNHFGDLNSTEFTRTMNGFDNRLRMKRRNSTVMSSVFLPPLNTDADHLPKEVDWRKEGFVTPVKDQGQCGSCWAFSATGSLEGQHFRKTGKLTSLSEQNLVDCSRPEGNNGCEGGLMDQAFEYVKMQHGIDDENDYPYEAKDKDCRYRSQYEAATDTGFVDVTQGSEHALKQAVAHVGPISVAIDASHSSFQFYSSGVYDEPQCSSEQLDHGVLVVGYGTENGKDYWLVKNSWNTSWGEDGYIKMSRNKDNQCGIATTASYPIV